MMTASDVFWRSAAFSWRTSNRSFSASSRRLPSGIAETLTTTYPAALRRRVSASPTTASKYAGVSPWFTMTTRPRKTSALGPTTTVPRRERGLMSPSFFNVR